MTNGTIQGPGNIEQEQVMMQAEARSLSSRGNERQPLQLEPIPAQIPNSAMKATSKYVGSPTKFIGKATPTKGGKLRASGSLTTI